MTAKNRKIMKMKSRKLLRDIILARTDRQVERAFEACYEVKIKEKPIKPRNIERIYEEIDKSVKGKWEPQKIREAFNEKFNEFFRTEVK